MTEERNNAVGPQVRNKKKNTRSRLHAAIAVFGLLLGIDAATQYFAYLFVYHPALGAHYQHIYPPWMIFIWAVKWYAKYPTVFMKAGSAGLIISGLTLLGVAFAKIAKATSANPNEFLHGSARWAGKEDIEQAGLLSSTGVYVGAWIDKNGKHHYLRHNGPEHVLCYAPTRSGKGVGLVIPTLLSWPHSAVVTDLKGELWALTAGWRQKHANNKVLRFEPASPTLCVAWNPLEEIRLGTEYEVGDVQNLATLLVDPDGKGLTDHWQKTSQALLVGCMLHLLYKAKIEGITATLNTLDSMLADPTRPIRELWMEMMHYSHINGENHAVIGSAGRDMADRPDDEAGSVLSTAKSYLSLYRDPVVAHNVRKSEFKIKDLMNHENPVTLYIITQPNDKNRLRPLIRVLVNMVVRLLADKMDFEKGRPAPKYKHRLLGMLDEFPSLGRLEIMQESLAFVAGYGMKFYLIIQDMSQLQSAYGRDESITSNCHIQNAYPPNKLETADHLSKLTGQTTIIKKSVTTSGKRFSGALGNVSTSIQEVQRALLTTDECLRMPGPKKDSDGSIVEAGDMVVYCAGFPAIYGQQPLYFKDKLFQARSEIEAPKVSDKIISNSIAATHKEIVL